MSSPSNPTRPLVVLAHKHRHVYVGRSNLVNTLLHLTGFFRAIWAAWWSRSFHSHTWDVKFNPLPLDLWWPVTRKGKRGCIIISSSIHTPPQKVGGGVAKKKGSNLLKKVVCITKKGRQQFAYKTVIDMYSCQLRNNDYNLNRNAIPLTVVGKIVGDLHAGLICWPSAANWGWATSKLLLFLWFLISKPVRQSSDCSPN